MKTNQIISEAHSRITKVKGKEYAPNVNELQKEVDIIEKEQNDKQPYEFTRCPSDGNGNPYFACHFLRLLNESDKIKSDHYRGNIFGNQYDLAVNRAKQIGGKKYHNRSYGGGIKFSMYAGQEIEMTKKIKELKTINTDYKKEWTPKDFTKVYRAIKDFSFLINSNTSKTDK